MKKWGAAVSLILILTVGVGLGMRFLDKGKAGGDGEERVAESQKEAESNPSTSSGQDPSTLGSSETKPAEDKVTQQSEEQPITTEGGKPIMEIDKNKKYSVTLKTSIGDITIELNAKETPITANNFYYLAKTGFYNNTIFHRVVKGFVIQGGDPKGDGTGGPGYKFDDEPFSGEYTRGTVAMANSGSNTNGSQFLLCTEISLYLKTM